jgi:hypothetical protein
MNTATFNIEGLEELALTDNNGNVVALIKVKASTATVFDLMINEETGKHEFSETDYPRWDFVGWSVWNDVHPRGAFACTSADDFRTKVV